MLEPAPLDFRYHSVLVERLPIWTSDGQNGHSVATQYQCGLLKCYFLAALSPTEFTIVQLI
jgi:hypothetical protein